MNINLWLMSQAYFPVKTIYLQIIPENFNKKIPSNFNALAIYKKCCCSGMKQGLLQKQEAIPDI